MAAPPVAQPKARTAAPRAPQSVPYDFRRPDAVSGDQLRTIQSVHENFVRLLGSSLSAYLRTFVSVSLARVEQLSFADFSKSLLSPAAVIPLRMRAQESSAVLGISHSALFPILEILLGGTGKPVAKIDREMTEIEKSILDPVIRIFVQELKNAWHPVSPVDFAIEQREATLQLLAGIPPNEGLVTVAVDIALAEAAGKVNLGLPARLVRSLLQGSHASTPEPSADHQSKILRLIERAELAVGVSLNGPRMLFRDLLSIEAGDVIAFDYPLSSELELDLNGTPKFKGHVVAQGAKRAFQITAATRPTEDRSPGSCPQQ